MSEQTIALAQTLGRLREGRAPAEALETENARRRRSSPSATSRSQAMKEIRKNW